MDNRYAEFLDKGTNQLMAMLPSEQLSNAEKQAIITAFTDELTKRICQYDTIEDAEVAIGRVSISYIDKRLSDILGKEGVLYREYDTALALCGRLSALIRFFKEKGIPVPAIVNADPAKCEQIIKQRHEDDLQANKLIRLDQGIDKAIAKAEAELSLDSCNDILVLVDEIKRELDAYKVQKKQIPSIKHQDTKQLYKRIADLQKISEKKESLYQAILDEDAKLAALNGLSAPSPAQWETAIVLCQQIKKLLADCKKKQWPLPAMKCSNLDAARSRFSLYQAMVTKDQEISGCQDYLSSEQQFKLFSNLCIKQSANIDTCKKNGWNVPELRNADPAEMLRNAKQAKKQKEETRQLKMKLIGAAVFILAIVLMIGFAIGKSREGKVSTPFNETYASAKNYLDISGEFESAGFTNIKVVESDSGWLNDGSVINVAVDGSETFKKGAYYEPDVSVVITYSCSGRVDIAAILEDWQQRDYSELIIALKAAGFKSITATEIATFDKDNHLRISEISLNNEMYTNGHCFLPLSAPIQIDYYSLRINVPNNNAAFVGQNYEQVVSSLREDGFTNVQTEEIMSGWAKGNSVIAVTFNGKTDYDKDGSYPLDTKIVVKYSSNDRLDITQKVTAWSTLSYQELSQSLRSLGFTNITVRQTNTSEMSKNHLISSLTLNGEDFNGGECHLQKTAPIEIEYYTLKITVGESASDIEGDGYIEVVARLKEMGFANITLMRADDLITGWITKEGSIKSITISGNGEFGGDESFWYDSEIIIIVHTFKDKGCEDITIVAE